MVDDNNSLVASGVEHEEGSVLWRGRSGGTVHPGMARSPILFIALLSDRCHNGLVASGAEHGAGL